MERSGCADYDVLGIRRDMANDALRCRCQSGAVANGHYLQIDVVNNVTAKASMMSGKRCSHEIMFHYSNARIYREGYLRGNHSGISIATVSPHRSGALAPHTIAWKSISIQGLSSEIVAMPLSCPPKPSQNA